jgi:SAM-dependent methyltransferase
MITPGYAQTLFNHLYGHINGYGVSNAARAKSGQNTEKLLYGELPFETWQQIVERAAPKSDGIFFDLGSGTGRIIIASYLLFSFRKSIGIELLEGLHNKALEVKDDFDKVVKPQVEKYISGRELTFINDNIFNIDLGEADFVFMNHPFKEGDDFARLEEKFLNELKPGTKIVTTIRALQNTMFKHLGKETYKFSWGDSTAHFAEI